jgi:hypothetical protein
MNQMDRISPLRRPHIIVEFSFFYFSNKMYHVNHSSLAYSKVYSYIFFFKLGITSFPLHENGNTLEFLKLFRKHREFRVHSHTSQRHCSYELDDSYLSISSSKSPLFTLLWCVSPSPQWHPQWRLLFILSRVKRALRQSSLQVPYSYSVVASPLKGPAMSSTCKQSKLGSKV